MSNKFDVQRFIYYLSKTLVNDILLANTYEPMYMVHLQHHLIIGPDSSRTSIERKLNEFVVADYRKYYGRYVIEVKYIPSDYLTGHLLQQLSKQIGCLIEIKDKDAILIK